MTLATDLRTFLLDADDFVIDSIHQSFVPEQVPPASGFAYYGRRGSEHSRTLGHENAPAEDHYFDIEIYHPDIEVAEACADALQKLDCYYGDFGSGRVGAVFVESQTDDYLPRVKFTDASAFHATFVSIQIRGYQPGS